MSRTLDSLGRVLSLLLVAGSVGLTACSQSAAPVKKAAVAPPAAAPAAANAADTAAQLPVDPSTTDGNIDLNVASAPPVPRGYPDNKAVEAAAMAQKIKMIQMPKDVPEGVTEHADVEYGKVGDTSLKLDLFVPTNLTKPVPAIVCIHGGGWAGGTKKDIRYFALPYAKKGYVVASVEYRMADKAKFPAAVQDVKAAVRWLRANAATYNVNPDAIGVAGWSAGGHLAMMVAYAPDNPDFDNSGGNDGVSSKVQACIDFYGPTDLTAPFAHGNPIVENFLGKKYDEDASLYAKVSPMTYLKAGAPPTIIFQGTVDTLVPVSQSDALTAKLKELNVPCFYDRMGGWPHVMDVQADINARVMYLTDAFVAKYLPLPQ